MNEEDAYRNLANAIVAQAAEDFRSLYLNPKRKIPELPMESLYTIRRFFSSDYCQLLCGDTDPLYILRELERERIEYIKLQEAN